MPLVRPESLYKPVERDDAVARGFDVFSAWEVAFSPE